MPKRSRSWADLPPRKMPMDKIVKDDYDRDLWERTMFQLRELPPKEPSWQNYFASVTASSFSLFLHYYEPELNRLAESFGRKYGLKDQLADIKLVCVEELWQLAQVYDPTSGEEFLANIQMKLMAAVQRHAMTNLKGFSETSATHYYQLRKAAYLYKENQGRISYTEIIRIICAELDITEKTALRLLQEMDDLDHFQWYTNIGAEEDEEEMDDPVGTDILGRCCAWQPEQIIIRKEMYSVLLKAFDELTDKEQDVIGMHLGFCHECGHIAEAKTYDEIADVYQFGTEDGVRRFYQRTLEKLRKKLADQYFSC